MDTREEFEAWAESEGYFTDQDEYGYRDEETGNVWYGWQEAMKRAEAKASGMAAGQCVVDGGLVGDEGGTPYCTLKAERDRLIDAGTHQSCADTDTATGWVLDAFEVPQRARYRVLLQPVEG